MKFKLSYNEPFEINSYINNVNRTVDLTTDMLPPLVVTITSSGNSITSDVTFEEAWNAYNDHRIIYCKIKLIYNDNEIYLGSGILNGGPLYNNGFAAFFTPGEQRLTGIIYSGYKSVDPTKGSDSLNYSADSSNLGVTIVKWTSSGIDISEQMLYGGLGQITLANDEGNGKTFITRSGEILFDGFSGSRSYTDNTIVVMNDLTSYLNTSNLSPVKTSALNDNKLLYNGQTVNSYINGIGLSNFNNLLGGSCYVALRSNNSNPFLGLTCERNNWYVQASGSYMYFGATSSNALKFDQTGNITVQNGSIISNSIVKAGATKDDFLMGNGSTRKLTLDTIVGRLYRTNVSGSGNISITNNSGFIPTTTTAGTYTVTIVMVSTTQSYGLRVTYGGNTYELSTTNGKISDSRTFTVAANAAWAATVIGSVAANSIINVTLSIPGGSIHHVGPAAVTNNYVDLDGKPSIPTVNNATLTIQKNGTSVATFTANSASNATANIIVPTSMSDLSNDVGYINTIKSVNGVTMVGSGDLTVVGSNQPTSVVTVNGGSVTQAMDPNVLYKIGNTNTPCTSLTITLNAGNNNTTNYYHAIVTCAANMTFTKPSSVKMGNGREIPSFTAGSIFEFNILENIMYFGYTED